MFCCTASPNIHFSVIEIHRQIWDKPICKQTEKRLFSSAPNPEIVWNNFWGRISRTKWNEILSIDIYAFCCDGIHCLQDSKWTCYSSGEEKQREKQKTKNNAFVSGEGGDNFVRSSAENRERDETGQNSSSRLLRHKFNIVNGNGKFSLEEKLENLWLDM